MSLLLPKPGVSGHVRAVSSSGYRCSIQKSRLSGHVGSVLRSCQPESPRLSGQRRFDLLPMKSSRNDRDWSSRDANDQELVELDHRLLSKRNQQAASLTDVPSSSQQQISSSSNMNRMGDEAALWSSSPSPRAGSLHRVFCTRTDVEPPSSSMVSEAVLVAGEAPESVSISSRLDDGGAVEDGRLQTNSKGSSAFRVGRERLGAISGPDPYGLNDRASAPPMRPNKRPTADMKDPEGPSRYGYGSDTNGEDDGAYAALQQQRSSGFRTWGDSDSSRTSRGEGFTMPINPPPGQTSERGGWSVPAEGAVWGLSSRPTMQSSYEDDADTEQASALGSRQLDWDEDPAVVVEEDPSQSSGAPLPNPGMDRAPAQPLRLIVEGTYATQTFPPGRLPLVGPWVISNSLRAWPATDCFANLQSSIHKGLQLALRFEYVADRGAPGTAPELHVYNISRVQRGHVALSAAYVNGKQLLPGDRGAKLQPDDVVEIDIHPNMSNAGKALRLVVKPAEVDSPSHIAAALGMHARGVKQPQGQNGGSTPLASSTLKELMSKGPTAAGGALRAEVVRDPSNSAAWLAWAQLAARTKRYPMARNLFRAALEAADASVKEADEEEARIAAEKLFFRSQLPSSGVLPKDRRFLEVPGGNGRSSSDDEGSDGEAETVEVKRSAPRLSARKWTPPPPLTTSSLKDAPASWLARRKCMQVLFNWAHMEWSRPLSNQGSARHLWRRAADLSYKHPEGAAQGGHAQVMLAWAKAEYERDNVGNARIILAEALRRSPGVQALYVLAANIELVAGNLDLAKGFCSQAYEMNRLDEELFLVWPRVMAAMGEPGRAQTLFERALEYHPRSLRILTAYAEVEAQQGDADMARELHERALALDEEDGMATLINRAAWAALEVDEGQFEAARELLDSALSIVPDHAPSLLVLSRLERLSGDLQAAHEALERVGQIKGKFDVEALTERTLLHRAYGERDLARSLDAHLRSMKRLKAMKHAGHSGWEAWRQFFSEAREEGRRELTKKAQARKVELGLWSVNGPGGVAGPRGGAKGGPSGGVVGRVPVAWSQRQDQVKQLVREREELRQQRELERAKEREREAMEQRVVDVQEGEGAQEEDDDPSPEIPIV